MAIQSTSDPNSSRTSGSPAQSRIDFNAFLGSLTAPSEAKPRKPGLSRRTLWIVVAGRRCVLRRLAPPMACHQADRASRACPSRRTLSRSPASGPATGCEKVSAIQRVIRGSGDACPSKSNDRAAPGSAPRIPPCTRESSLTVRASGPFRKPWGSFAGVGSSPPAE